MRNLLYMLNLLYMRNLLYILNLLLERVRESDRHELLKLPIALIILTLRSIIETRIEEDIR